MSFLLIMSMTEDGSDSKIASFFVLSTHFQIPMHYHRRQFIEVNGYFLDKIDTHVSPKYTRWKSKIFNSIAIINKGDN